jgi:putative radical SAM enzyme (TIGR03279 family)
MIRTIRNVDKYSIAADFGIEVGDKLIAKNGTADFDIFDYYLAIAGTHMNILIEKPDGSQFFFDFEKDENEDIGLSFNSRLLDGERTCVSNCIFCNIDQNPKDIMHDAIYFKDDDYRLSFTQGNYVSLTNMTKHDVERIIRHQISPVNVSVHTTDPSLRTKMMGNKAAGRCLKYLDRLAAGGIAMGMQVVLCKGLNDGKHLDKTIQDLARFVPKNVNGGGFSLSVVPVGLTQYRHENDLPYLEPFDAEDCKKIIEQIEEWQLHFLKEFGTHFVYASDEFYVKAGVKLPLIEVYEEFLQIENGVGMMTLFKDTFEYACRAGNLKPPGTKVTMATSVMAYDFLRGLGLPESNLDIVPIKNNFYGEHIAVSGLLTGQDIINQLKGRDLGDTVLLPSNCLRRTEEVLLDGITLSDISNELGVKVSAVLPTGEGFVSALKKL